MFFALFCAGQQLATGLIVVARSGVVAAALLGVYALWELLFGPPIAIAATTRRLLGPFGSAAYLGAACCLLAPIAIGVAFDRAEDLRWRWVGVAAATLATIAAVGSGTRAAWVGAAVAAGIVVVAMRPNGRSALLCICGLFVAVLTV